MSGTSGSIELIPDGRLGFTVSGSTHRENWQGGYIYVIQISLE